MRLQRRQWRWRTAAERNPFFFCTVVGSLSDSGMEEGEPRLCLCGRKAEKLWNCHD